MIIEIESVYGDVLITGKHLEQNRLRMIVKELLPVVGEQNFVDSFCMRYGYEFLSASDDIHADCIIDLDTHTVIKPTH